MVLEGRREFRFSVGSLAGLYLVTTDADDGADDDVMIWEHGVVERGGHDEPWTAAMVTDATGAEVAWGSHPVAAAAALPHDSVAVHAPAVLHIVFPPGTTGFRVEARADPVYAKDGSMQAVPMTHAPSGEELHFASLRWVFGAPASARRKALEAASHERLVQLMWPSGYTAGRGFPTCCRRTCARVGPSTWRPWRRCRPGR